MNLVHPDDIGLMSKMSEKVEPHPLEERLKRLSGGYFIAEVTSAPIVFHGMHARQVVIRDITERKQVHAQLVQTAKLATLGEMAAGMAHELSQPINIIRMAAEGTLLLIGRHKASQEYQSKQFNLMAQQAARMAEIIDHIRIFSRKDTGEVVVFDARNSLHLAVELMEPQMKSREISVDLSMPEAPCPVLGRPVQLEQVIINLLSNAADAVSSARKTDAVPRPGRVVINATIRPQGLLCVVVTDNGTGNREYRFGSCFRALLHDKRGREWNGAGSLGQFRHHRGDGRTAASPQCRRRGARSSSLRCLCPPNVTCVCPIMSFKMTRKMSPLPAIISYWSMMSRKPSKP